jgi:hypothetical protein
MPLVYCCNRWRGTGSETNRLQGLLRGSRSPINLFWGSRVMPTETGTASRADRWSRRGVAFRRIAPFVPGQPTRRTEPPGCRGDEVGLRHERASRRAIRRHPADSRDDYPLARLLNPRRSPATAVNRVACGSRVSEAGAPGGRRPGRRRRTRSRRRARPGGGASRARASRACGLRWSRGRGPAQPSHR